jgi:uncharacterized protein
LATSGLQRIAHRTLPSTTPSTGHTPVQATAPLDDDDLTRLQTLLDAVPEPLQAMDVSALDGYLCGVLLQPRAVPFSRWWPYVIDVEGRPAGTTSALDEVQALVQRRHAELNAAIGNRQWFDPWIYQLDDDASPGECVLPWTAGFAAAMEFFPELMAMDDPEMVEPLALLFMHFDPQDLEDADALIAVIDTLEPPTDMGEAVQDVVRALMLLADVSRPRAKVPALPRAPRKAGGPARRPVKRGPR